MSKGKVVTDSNFKTDVLDSKVPVLLDFWAEWCGPCRMLSPVLDRIADANQGKIELAKLNVDENQETPQQFGIQGIPTLILFKDGKPIQQMVGFQSQDNIQKVINETLGR